MRLLRNWFRPRSEGQLIFHVNMQLHSSMQSILVSIFRLGLLRLSAGTYEAISSTSAYLVSHWERF